MFLKVKTTDDTNSSQNLLETKPYEEGLCIAVSVLIFANFTFHALSLDPLGDHVIPCGAVHTIAQVSYGNISVLSDLKSGKCCVLLV